MKTIAAMHEIAAMHAARAECSSDSIMQVYAGLERPISAHEGRLQEQMF